MGWSIMERYSGIAVRTDWTGPSKHHEDEKFPADQVPPKVYVGLHEDWYYGWEGKKEPSIKEVGILARIKQQFKHEKNRRDSVYVATSPRAARAYALVYAKPMIVEIDTKKLDPDKWYYDPMDVDGTQIAYRGDIPPEAISVYEGW